MKLRLLAGFLAAAALWAQDGQQRVGRVSFLYGAVQYRPAAAQDWGDAALNLPLSAGDHLFTDLNSQTEVRAAAIAVHLAPQTGVAIVTLDDATFRLSITEGAVNVRIARMNDGERVEITAPSGTFRILSPGTYRVDVVPAGGYVSLIVRSGAAEAVAGPQTVTVSPGQRLVLAGVPATLEFVDAPPLDAWDEWCEARDADAERAIELAEPYVSWEESGAEELAANGDWASDGESGFCWVPRYVSADWAPFRSGRWIYKAPWGWTWIDDAAWAFITSHYGRWAHVKQGWAWVPAHRHRKEPYSPATVAFAPGDATRRVAWAPLAPGESPTAGARRNRDAATSAEAAAFQLSRPVGHERVRDGERFTARAPAVEPTREATLGGRVHPAKPDAEARAVVPLPRVEPVAPRAMVEDRRAAPAPAPPHVEEAQQPQPQPQPQAEDTQRRRADEDRRAEDNRRRADDDRRAEENRRAEDTRRADQQRQADDSRRAQEHHAEQQRQEQHHAEQQRQTEQTRRK